MPKNTFKNYPKPEEITTAITEANQENKKFQAVKKDWNLIRVPIAQGVILMALEAEEKPETDKLRLISSAHADKPILFKYQDKIYLYGMAPPDQTWKITNLEKPKTDLLLVFPDKGAVVLWRDEVEYDLYSAIQKGHNPGYHYYLHSQADLLGKGNFGSVFQGAAIDASGNFLGDVAIKKSSRGKKLPKDTLDRLAYDEAKFTHVSGQFTENPICVNHDYYTVTAFINAKEMGVWDEDDRQMDWNKNIPRKDLHKLIQFFARLSLRLNDLHHEKLSHPTILHKDLKPENILLDQRLNPYLIDFGLSFSLQNDDPTQLFSTLVAGTPPYMAPEVSRREGGIKSNVYSFAAIIFAMLGCNIKLLWEAKEAKQKNNQEQQFIWQKEIQTSLKSALDYYESLTVAGVDMKDFLYKFLLRALGLEYGNRPSDDEVLQFFITCDYLCTPDKTKDFYLTQKKPLQKELVSLIKDLDSPQPALSKPKPELSVAAKEERARLEQETKELAEQHKKEIAEKKLSNEDKKRRAAEAKALDKKWQTFDEKQYGISQIKSEFAAVNRGLVASNNPYPRLAKLALLAAGWWDTELGFRDIFHYKTEDLEKINPAVEVKEKDVIESLAKHTKVKTFANYDFDNNEIICEAIVKLNANKLLEQKLVQQLMSDVDAANAAVPTGRASLIILLDERKMLTKETIPTNPADDDSKANFQALAELSTASPEQLKALTWDSTKIINFYAFLNQNQLVPVQNRAQKINEILWRLGDLIKTDQVAANLAKVTVVKKNLNENAQKLLTYLTQQLQRANLPKGSYLPEDSLKYKLFSVLLARVTADNFPWHDETTIKNCIELARRIAAERRTQNVVASFFYKAIGKENTTSLRDFSDIFAQDNSASYSP